MQTTSLFAALREFVVLSRYEDADRRRFEVRRAQTSSVMTQSSMLPPCSQLSSSSSAVCSVYHQVLLVSLILSTVQEVTEKRKRGVSCGLRSEEEVRVPLPAQRHITNYFFLPSTLRSFPCCSHSPTHFFLDLFLLPFFRLSFSIFMPITSNLWVKSLHPSTSVQRGSQSKDGG